VNFLAIDTSGKHLTVLAVKGERVQKTYKTDCAHQHSVELMDVVDETLRKVGLTLPECDFFAVVVGAGSFTGIRIGIATVKGFCYATGKPALAITSFDVLAYVEGKGNVLALVDAGHDFVYACGYDKNMNVDFPPAYLPLNEAQAMKGYTTIGQTEDIDLAEGLYRAVLSKQDEMIDAKLLKALYVRKSSAEEKR